MSLEAIAQDIPVLFRHLERLDQLRLAFPSFGYRTRQGEAHAHLNRYSDVVPYDHALLPGAYLNASLIPPFAPGPGPGSGLGSGSGGVSYIASQAPPPRTFEAFYAHLVGQDCRVLVNLTPLTERGRAKADQYWPSSTSTPLRLADGTSIHLLEQTRPAPDLTLRTLHIQPANHTLTQLHLTAWPDHATFPLSNLLHHVTQLQSSTAAPASPLWVHCSAGLGRSGTLIAAHAAMHALRSNPSDTWDLPLRIVEHLRRYRARMVQTPEQLLAVWEAVLALQSENAKASAKT